MVAAKSKEMKFLLSFHLLGFLLVFGFLALYYVMEFVKVTLNFDYCFRSCFENFCLPLFSETK